MNCLDCHDQEHLAAPAVSVCSECGAGACRDHAVVRDRVVHRIGVMGRLDAVDPPARVIRCRACDAAYVAQHTLPGRRERSPR